MNGEWCYFKQRFSKEQCELILEHGLKLPEIDAKIGVKGDLVVDETRRSKVRFIQSLDPNFTFLFDEIWRMGIQANADWFNFHVTKLSFIH